MQEPNGVILSMSRFLISKPGDTFWGSILFLGQLIFLIWTYVFDIVRRIIIIIITMEIVFLSVLYGWAWFYLFCWLAAWTIYTHVRGQVPLWLILKAARVIHVRLCLYRIERTNKWRYVSQTRRARADDKIDAWDDSQLLGKHFIYMAPGINVNSVGFLHPFCIHVIEAYLNKVWVLPQSWSIK